MSQLFKQFEEECLRLSAAISCNSVLDAPCGFGRLAIELALSGLDVVGLDNDPRQLERLREEHASSRIRTICGDIYKLDNLFADCSFIGAVNVDLVDISLLSKFNKTLVPNGLFYFKSYSNRGGNYLHLPQPGAYRRELVNRAFEVMGYKESPAGPPGANAVTVELLARKVVQ